jgi:hypothetical protein
LTTFIKCIPLVDQLLDLVAIQDMMKPKKDSSFLFVMPDCVELNVSYMCVEYVGNVRLWVTMSLKECG